MERFLEKIKVGHDEGDANCCPDALLVLGHETIAGASCQNKGRIIPEKLLDGYGFYNQKWQCDCGKISLAPLLH